MANISQNVNIEMLEKLPDGTYKRKYPKTRADDGTTFDEHLADKATQNEYGHIRLSDIPLPSLVPKTKGIRALTTDPSNPEDGEIWLNSASKTLRIALDGASIPIDFAGEEPIYYSGSEFIPIVAGYTSGDGTLLKRATSLRLTTSKGTTTTTNMASFVTDIPISLAGVKSIRVNVSLLANSGAFYLVASTSKMGGYGEYDAQESLLVTGEREVVLDTIGLVGEYYIRCHQLAKTSTDSRADVSSIMLIY